MVYVKKLVLGEIRPELLGRLARGELVRSGGVLRVAVGHEHAGAIAAHLRDIAADSVVPEALMGTLRLGQVAAAASILNLGVSAVGFAVVTHKLNRLQDSVGRLSALVSSNQKEIQGQFATLSAQLVELRWLSLSGLDVCQRTLEAVRQLRADMLDAYFARVITYADELSRTSTVREADARAALLVFGEARRWSEQRINRTPMSEPEHWHDRLVSYRLWCIATTAELHLLRRIGEDLRAAKDARTFAAQARGWSTSWNQALLPPTEYGGVFRFSHSKFAALPRETYERLVRQFDRTELGLTDPRELDARMLVARKMPSLDERWAERQLSAATMLDFVEETASRLESTADELEFCELGGLDYTKWESLPSQPGAGTLRIIEREVEA